MRRSWLVLMIALVLWSSPVPGKGDPPVIPPPEPLNSLPRKIVAMDHGIEMPPQMFDATAKMPNNMREPHGEWTVSGGIYIMEPVFQTNPALLISRTGGNITRQVDFRHHLDVAPQVWLGYVSERGWGVRGRWFQFDRDASESAAAEPGETVRGISPLNLGQMPLNGTIFTSSNLALNVLDFQATHSHECNRWTLLEAFGVRYTHLSQDYRASLGGTDPATGLFRTIDLTSGHNFNGAGPSFSFEAKHRIGETGFFLYGDLHGAILFGTMNEAYTAVNTGIPQELTRSHTSVLPVGDMEIGGEYCRNMGRAKIFIQSGFLGQVWWSGGNASNVDPIGFSSAMHHNFGFVGLSLRAGIRY